MGGKELVIMPIQDDGWYGNQEEEAREADRFAEIRVIVGPVSRDRDSSFEPGIVKKR